MKKIILLFFTFLGICSSVPQLAAQVPDTAGANPTARANKLPLKQDSVIREKPSMRLYPNPTKNSTEIGIKGLEPGFIKVQLMTNAGRLLREEKRLIVSGNDQVVLMFSEKPGLYFVFVKQGKTVLKSKLLIQ